MKRNFLKGVLMFVGMMCYWSGWTQVELSGTITDSLSRQSLPAVSVSSPGMRSGTFTDENGRFLLRLPATFPVNLLISSVGYESKEITVNSAASIPLEINLLPVSSLGEAVVVSASRTPERLLESPVSIERIGAAEIGQTPATGYYDMLRHLKGVDLIYSSLTFATPSTRGFNGSGNPRLNQLVDGMDNQAPGLNFSVGSMVGVTELDVASMELLPGASSALYGSGGMNGTLLINSKDPFRFQGLSYQVKTGIMHVDKKQQDRPGAYHDWSLRWAKKTSEKFAFKINAQFIQARDWIATDYSNYQAGDVTRSQYGEVKPGDPSSDPNYDGVNVYGDETTLNLTDPLQPVLVPVAEGIRQQLEQQLPSSLYEAAAAYLDSTVNSYNNFQVSRTGYKEKDVLDNLTVNVKLSGGVYYNLTPGIQASLVGYWGTGNTVYTGSDRYALRNLKIGQYKMEVRHRDWFVRAYTTQENAGESFNATITTRIFNEAWKPSTTWYPQYAQGFLLSKINPYIEALATGSAFMPVVDPAAHASGRQFADQGRPVAGSTSFRNLYDQVRSTPISQGGGLFLDRSDLYVTEGQYRVGSIGNIGDLLVGAGFKQYVLDSRGTLFADTAGPIRINEAGAYAQLSKSLLNDRLKLTAAGRYDKNENFAGRFTPRLTAVYELKENHHLRASYQTAYRFPTTQNQWINLVIGGGTVLLGGLPELRDFYQFDQNKVYTVNSVRAAGFALFTGTPPDQAFALLEEKTFKKYQPETLRSFELGYKGRFNKKLLVDVYTYFGRYKNFLGRTVVLQSMTGNPMGLFSVSTLRSLSVAVNSTQSVSTYGAGLGVDYLLPGGFTVTGNISSDRINNDDPDFVTFFNAPDYRLVLGISRNGFGPQKRFGFNVNLRNQSGYYFESDFRQGNIDGYTTIDAQVNYRFFDTRSMLKLGATNITNQYYRTAFANPAIGGIYYLSFGYNVF